MTTLADEVTGLRAKVRAEEITEGEADRRLVESRAGGLTYRGALELIQDGMPASDGYREFRGAGIREW